MATNVQQYLANLEMTPPPGAWNAIADRLQNEYDASEAVVAQKMQDLAVTPPTLVWEAIEANLPQQITPQQPAELVRLPYRRVRMLVAAAVIGLIGLTGWYFLNYEGAPTVRPVVVQQQQSLPSVPKNTAPVTTLTPPEVAADQIQEHFTRKSSHEPPVMHYASNAGIRNNYAYDYQPVATNYAEEMEAVPLTRVSSPSENAPLIRDANGDIIMDKRLITSPDNQYITITGPNGQQTRISAKFLDIISTLNSEIQPQEYFDYMLHENYLWKIRFREWRNKLMNQSSFIDMLELKDMLQETQE